MKMKASSTTTRQLVVAHKRDLLVVFAELHRMAIKIKGLPHNLCQSFKHCLVAHHVNVRGALKCARGE